MQLAARLAVARKSLSHLTSLEPISCEQHLTIVLVVTFSRQTISRANTALQKICGITGRCERKLKNRSCVD
jgi:hypothetical protein